eukprot:5502987-Pyramimonas_sp.AAC.1
MRFPGGPKPIAPAICAKDLFVIYADVPKGAYRYRRVGGPTRTGKAFGWNNIGAKKAWGRAKFHVRSLHVDSKAGA